VDPKNPGAVDEIIHLGDFWDEDTLRENKQAILSTNRRIWKLFQMACFSLKEAKAIQEEWESYITEAMNFSRVNETAAVITQGLFTNIAPDYNSQPGERHLFASAITPDGPQNYLDTILQGVETLYVIKGEPGSGKATLIKKIADRAKSLGLCTENYHCAFVPQNTDLVVIPKLGAAVANLSAPVSFDPDCLPNLQAWREFDLSSFTDREIIGRYAEEIRDCRHRFEAAFDRAVGFIGRAKAEHDLLESYYIPAMNFEALNGKRDEIMERILKYAKE